MGVWGVATLVPSVMRAVKEVPSWAECVSRRADVVRLCLPYTQLPFRVRCPCAIRSLPTFVSDSSGDHMVETYSSMGLVMALYVAIIVSLCFPHVVDVSVLSICIVLRAFVVMVSM